MTIVTCAHDWAGGKLDSGIRHELPLVMIYAHACDTSIKRDNCNPSTVAQLSGHQQCM
jgi:hypothetical protein